MNNDSLLAEFGRLWSEADQLWETHQDEPAFCGYVSADYEAVYHSLVRLQGRVFNILEWGSGLGVVTIMASRLGFEAYGIESEPDLVRHAEDFARVYGPQARFSIGSFIPDEYQWDPASGDEIFRTVVDIPAAYSEFDMELRDFDLVYAYPWPDEHSLFRNIIRNFGRKESLLLSYDAREGMQLVRVGDGSPWS